jgi:transcriptional regulator
MVFFNEQGCQYRPVGAVSEAGRRARYRGAMYVPAHFATPEPALEDLLTGMGAADLITMTESGLVATHLPLIYDATSGSLLGHVARNNDQWKRPAIGEALAIVHGPGGYITPSWYATKKEHGRVVPTWNYVTAHVYGDLVVHDDPQWVEALVRRLTGKHEEPREHSWSVDDAPEAYIAGQLRAIVGLELRITRIEAKSKLSQNRPAEDIDGVIAGLRAAGEEDHAAAVEAAR